MRTAYLLCSIALCLAICFLPHSAVALDVELSATVPAPSADSLPDTNVIFSGTASPLSQISIFKDGHILGTTTADADSTFTVTVRGLKAGTSTFTIVAEDKNNIRSSPVAFPLFIPSGVTTKVSNIFIAPAAVADTSEVKPDEYPLFFVVILTGAACVYIASKFL